MKRSFVWTGPIINNKTIITTFLPFPISILIVTITITNTSSSKPDTPGLGRAAPNSNTLSDLKCPSPRGANLTLSLSPDGPLRYPDLLMVMMNILPLCLSPGRRLLKHGSGETMTTYIWNFM
uniref:Uncharacterized protein n=1 Tax=Nothobranchius furzeri TaxID=105023 RepID=A0A1A8ARP5_NOTFU